MKIKEGEKLIKSFVENCEKNSDPYLVVHFSKEDNHFQGTHDFMDSFDAIIVIKNLIKEFGIDKRILAKMS